MRTYLVFVIGIVEPVAEVQAHSFDIVDGAIIFEDSQGYNVFAKASGYWVSVEVKK